MIDFNNATFVKLRQTGNDHYESHVAPLLSTNEQIVATYISMRDGVVFTNKRMIAVNVQGMTGKKKDFTSLPYNRIQAYSIETAGHFDLDTELELWFSGMGRIRFEFTSGSDVTLLCRTISEYALPV